MITYSFLEKEDLEGLKNLYEIGFESSVKPIKPMQNTFEKVKNNPAYNILCAKDRNKVVGSVLGVVCQELFGNCQPFMVLEDVVVLPEYRRNGIAKNLMVLIEEKAKEQNCSMIVFVSSKHRTGAHKLYESLGFGEDMVNGYRKRISYS